jgi:hypothetical protein
MPPRIWIPHAATTVPPATQRSRRSEALSLYREILRTAKHFHWADEKTGACISVAFLEETFSAVVVCSQLWLEHFQQHDTSHITWIEPSGKPWNKILREQARKEFEESRNETDPLIIARMLVTGRDCVQQVQNKFNDATQAAWKRIDSSRRG